MMILLLLMMMMMAQLLLGTLLSVRFNFPEVLDDWLKPLIT